MCFAMLWGVVFIPEIIGRKGMLFLCVLSSFEIIGGDLLKIFMLLLIFLREVGV